MAMNLSGNGGLDPQINVTPLIDVLLVLIIIFLMIQPRHPNGLPTEVPQDSHNPSVTPPPDTLIVLEIATTADGKPALRINSKEVPWPELESKLRSIYATRAEKIMFLKGDAKLDFSNVAAVIDIVRAANPDIRVGLITRDLQNAD